jgi:hypothetical protein
MRAEVAGVVEGGQLAQLRAVGLREQKRVAHAELRRLLVTLRFSSPITTRMNFGAPSCFAGRSGRSPVRQA